jgi:hypothetical protein
LHPARNAKLLGAPLIIFIMLKMKQVHDTNFQLNTKSMHAMNFVPINQNCALRNNIFRPPAVSLSRSDHFVERLVRLPK